MQDNSICSSPYYEVLLQMEDLSKEYSWRPQILLHRNDVTSTYLITLCYWKLLHRSVPDKYGCSELLFLSTSVDTSGNFTISTSGFEESSTDSYVYPWVLNLHLFINTANVLNFTKTLPCKMYQHFFVHTTVTLSTVQSLKAYEWRYNSTHSSLGHWIEVSGQFHASAGLPLQNYNSNVTLFYILNGERHFEGLKQKTFQEQLIEPVLRNVSFVTVIIQNGLQKQRSFYVPPPLKTPTFCPHSVFICCTDLRTNSDYFPTHH
jgi:hypothetical protein